MVKQSQKLESLTAPIAQRARQLFAASLGYEPEKVDCQRLDSYDLLIDVKRAPSATENFLKQQSGAAEAQEMGSTINRILKNRLVLALTKEFGLTVAEVSVLEPADSCRFSLFILLEWPSALSGQSVIADTTTPLQNRRRDIAL